MSLGVTIILEQVAIQLSNKLKNRSKKYFFIFSWNFYFSHWYFIRKWTHKFFDVLLRRVDFVSRKSSYWVFSPYRAERPALGGWRQEIWSCG